ncbi:MAG: amidohydrolase family protein [Solirubrobacterales bacterium]|nr:amidohydrolase family protein [Solirubrobacterales bacterium]
MTVIDCHCHAGAGDGLNGPWDTRADLRDYLPRAREAGIDHTVVFAPFHSDYVVANREVARIVSMHPDRLTGFAFAHCADDRDRMGELVAEAVHRLGLRGLKAHRHDARIGRELCEAARRHAIPILYDPMGELGPVELVACEYPDVDFIIPHLGSFADDWNAQRQLIDILVRHPNVYTDTSGVRRFDLLVEAVRRAGPGKVLFGTDGPWLHPEIELEKVRLLGLRGEDERLVCGGNLARLLGRAGPQRHVKSAPTRELGEAARPAGDPWERLPRIA